MYEQFWLIALVLIIVIVLFWPSVQPSETEQTGGALVRYYPSYWRSHFFPYRRMRYWGRYPRYWWWDRWVPRRSTYYW